MSKLNDSLRLLTGGEGAGSELELLSESLLLLLALLLLLLLESELLLEEDDEEEELLSDPDSCSALGSVFFCAVLVALAGDFLAVGLTAASSAVSSVDTVVLFGCLFCWK